MAEKEVKGIKKFFEEFKAFAMRGNVLDMAVGVVIGGALTAIVTSLVNDIITPSIGLFFNADFSDVGIHVGDVMIGISFPRYSMRTLKALEFASNRKAKVITLTDSVHSPMNLYSSCNLIARSDMASIVDSLVAPLSVINALVVALCMKKQKEVIQTLETLEDI
mgnify:CR=1 FL=1